MTDTNDAGRVAEAEDITEERLREIEALLAHVGGGGPHEWGYRCLAEGTFIEDNWPFQAADALSDLAAALRKAWAENERLRAHVRRETEDTTRDEDEDSLVYSIRLQKRLFRLRAALNPSDNEDVAAALRALAEQEGEAPIQP